jgi:hypothetical protein
MSLETTPIGAGESSPAPDGSAPQYTIATVGDFLKVPEERQADCLTEFADFLGMARGIVELASIVGEIVGADAAATIGPYTWIDDGKKNRTIRISAQNAQHHAEAGRPIA